MREVSSIHSIDDRNRLRTARFVRLAQEGEHNLALIPKGSTLYHYSSWIREIVGNRFNPEFSGYNGAFFFSDLPSDHTNCQVAVTSDLIVYRWDRNKELEKHMQRRTTREVLGELMTKGYDGRIFSNSDYFIQRSDGIPTTEITVFQASLKKLGLVEAFSHQ